MVVNLAEEVLSSVLQAAEALRGAVLAAESGCIESLRWSGAMPLLLRDFGVENVLSAEQLLACESSETLRRLLGVSAASKSVEHVVLMLSGFLWDYEAALKRLLTLNVVARLTICSSLSERAHECYDRGTAALLDRVTGDEDTAMHFEEFAAGLLDKNAPERTANRAELKDGQHDDDWSWNEDGSADEFVADIQCCSEFYTCVRVVHLPLSVVPLLSSKTLSPEPSVFVLSHPTCASAFPLLLHQVEDERMFAGRRQKSMKTGGVGEKDTKMYAHVKDVLPEHIPSSFRKSMRLLAYTLAEMTVGAQLDVRDRIFAVGTTSLKIGHTLLRILSDMQEATPVALAGQQVTSMVILDRTCDLASPCSFDRSLLDRILDLLPQTPTYCAAGEGTSGHRTTTRRKLNVTDVFPLHGCEPTPLSMPHAATHDKLEYLPSEFVAQIQWKGGASLCHPTIPSSSNVFRSLSFRPAKLALRDLDRRLQAVEQDLIRQGSIQKSAATRRPGEKIRGRDVVLRRISKILEAGEPTNLEQSSLIELGVIVLETLNRMDRSQKRWDKCRERAVRHVELRKKGGCEWILPEVADAMQRQTSALQSGASHVNEDILSLHELLILLVNAFALSSGVQLEDFTTQMVQKALVEYVLQTVRTDPLAVEHALPGLYDLLVPYLGRNEPDAGHDAPDQVGIESGDWEWTDGGNSPTGTFDKHDDVPLLEARPVIETYVENLTESLEDCLDQSVAIHDNEATSPTEEEPQSLIARLCCSIVDPSGASSSAIHHVVDASEQLTRAGIDLLKSGLNKFGFGMGGGSSGDQHSTRGSRIMDDSSTLIVFVVGGITFKEIQEVHDALSDNKKYQIIIGGTTITNSDVILQKLFTF
ncbi:unnamed protein product [Hyaloperonospora brassicae]|uniref:Sec1 family domain-containing protein n=1 Tax=Hyaloperonospora brassicae TaxID=162125 RepID=A0AAV0T6J1_HYABA|nr:unnamed protein product [Hyaloperonospora brassicae]